VAYFFGATLYNNQKCLELHSNIGLICVGYFERLSCAKFVYQYLYHAVR